MLHKRTYPWDKYLAVKSTDETPVKKRGSQKSQSLPGYLNMEDLAREYHEFLRSNELYIIHHVSEDDVKGLHQYNAPNLYGSILCEARLCESGRKRRSTGSHEPRKAQKTRRDESPATAQRTKEAPTLPSQDIQHRGEESPTISEQTSCSEQSSLEQEEQAFPDQPPITNQQPAINPLPVVNQQPAIPEQPVTNEQPVMNEHAVNDTVASSTEPNKAPSNNAMLSFWDQFKVQQYRSEDVGTTGSMDEPGHSAGAEEVPAVYQPSEDLQPFPSYGNGSLDLTESFSFQPSDEQGLGGIQYNSSSLLYDDTLDFQKLFGEDSTSQ
ncbi:hypothetical protein F4820DRAFT_468738 [Hypoxylon rubiginosum]|uniref:Uncharacterized protein n=1 Tax=Hypoxylon rubiginosum TaxID=110542 RepID=A0ACB9Z550_9PEZI|nr:hypothetical protein F4820DRAFT_468738 [Hypoxylon rubiginosum]